MSKRGEVLSLFLFVARGNSVSMNDRLFPEERVQEKQFQGVCEKLLYESPESDYRVLELRLEDGRRIPVQGYFGPIYEGERLEVRGEFTQHLTYGRQLQVHDFKLILPQSVAEIERFLASGFIPGVGKKIAKLLVQHHGTDILRLMSEDPEKLKDTPGIGEKRLETMIKAWNERQGDREIQSILKGWGLTDRMIEQAKEVFGARILVQIKANPYLLAQKIRGIGFRKADEIALQLGFHKDDSKRILYSAQYLLEKALEGGHCYLPEYKLLEQLSSSLSIGFEVARSTLETYFEQKALLHFKKLGFQPVYLPKYYQLERETAQSLKSRQTFSSAETTSVSVCAELYQHLSPEQQQVVGNLIQTPLAILTGGPGVGKTTVIKALYDIFEFQGKKTYLAAPTGRAAKRLEMATQVPTQTIHRLLKIQPQHRVSSQVLLGVDVVILDECSMLDLELFHALLHGLAPRTRLYLVGDAEQLPSVGAGNVLADLIRSQHFPVYRLNQVFRQKKQSSITLNAHRILKQEPLFSDEGNKGEFYFIQQTDPQKIVALILEMLTQRIPQQFQISPLDVQILSPMKKGKLGTIALNHEIQQTLKKSEPLHQFCLGDKVMQIRNNYEKNVFNGDIGIIQELYPRGLQVRFADQRKIEYLPAEMRELQLAYAISIHKSQGSEFPCVLIPLHFEHYTMLQRNLLYTAVTRGKNLVILIGDPRALDRALHNNERTERYSHLASFIQEP